MLLAPVRFPGRHRARRRMNLRFFGDRAGFELHVHSQSLVDGEFRVGHAKDVEAVFLGGYFVGPTARLVTEDAPALPLVTVCVGFVDRLLGRKKCGERGGNATQADKKGGLLPRPP